MLSTDCLRAMFGSFQRNDCKKRSLSTHPVQFHFTDCKCQAASDREPFAALSARQTCCSVSLPMQSRAHSNMHKAGSDLPTLQWQQSPSFELLVLPTPGNSFVPPTTNRLLRLLASLYAFKTCPHSELTMLTPTSSCISSKQNLTCVSWRQVACKL